MSSGETSCLSCGLSLWFVDDPEGICRWYFDRKQVVHYLVNKGVRSVPCTLSTHMDFSDLGMDSLDVVEFILELEELGLANGLNVTDPVAKFFARNNRTNRTVADLLLLFIHLQER